MGFTPSGAHLFDLCAVSETIKASASGIAMAVVETVCGMCGSDVCGIDVHVEGGKIAKISGTRGYPTNRGRLCPQAAAALEMTYDRERLSYPMRSRGGLWERITWDHALDTIAERLKRLKDEDGAQALAVYQGRALLQFIRDGWVRRFMNLYGTPNFVRNEHMCALPIRIGEELTYGQSTIFYGFDPDRTKCLLLWGSNPQTSHLPTQWAPMLRAKKSGCKLIVVDPRRTGPASLADIHARPRFGTDPALALGLINVIIEESLYDAAFVGQWTSGFTELADAVRAYDSKRVETITGVPEETVREIARVYATVRPAYLDAGNSLEHHSNSRHIIRSVMILRAITGNLDVPGGHPCAPSLPLADVELEERRPTGLRPLGWDRYPILVSSADFVPGDVLMEALMDGEPYPVRSMIVGGGNPLVTWPNADLMRRALSKLDMLVVLDLYMTETAKAADIVLPMADHLERTQLITATGYFGPGRPPLYLMLRKQVKEAGERRSDWWFWSQLARRLGFEEEFPWTTVREAIDFQLAPLGLTTSDLEQNPGGVFFGEPLSYRTYERTGFSTPTGKVELASKTLEVHGYEAVPAHEEPAESPIGSPDLAASYPLVLNAGRRVAGYTHSRHRSLPSLRRREPEPLAEIHPETAAAYGVQDGAPVIVESPRGRIEMRAQLTDAILPGTVSVLHGWSEANANRLTDHAACDPVFACPPLRASLCRIRPRG